MRRGLSVISILIVVVLGAGLSSAQDAIVDVRNNSFDPQEVEIAPGDTVRWDVSGSNPHSITADDGSFDSHPNCPPACTTPGSSFEHTFDDAGAVAYYCKIHGGEGGVGMAGTVRVRAAGSNGGPQGPGNDEPPAREDTPGTGVPRPVASGIAVIAAAVFVRRALLARRY